MRYTFSVSLSETAGDILIEMRKKTGISISKYISDLIISQQETSREQAKRLCNFLLKSTEMTDKGRTEIIEKILKDLDKI